MPVETDTQIRKEAQKVGTVGDWTEEEGGA